MSGGVSRKGSGGQQQKAAINGSLNKTGANITERFPRPGFAGVRREFQQRAARGQTAWLLKLLSVMARKSGSALLIDQSKGNKAANLQTQSRKPIELASFPARSIGI